MFNKKNIIYVLFILSIVIFSFLYKDNIYKRLFAIKKTISIPGEYLKKEFLSNDLLYDENIKLKKDNQRINLLEFENNELKSKISELNKLMDLNYNNNNYIYASVVYRNIYNWNDCVTINKGKSDGIYINDVVIANSLIGRVTKVYEDFSVVSLIISNKEKIAVKINEKVGAISNYNNGVFSVEGFDLYSGIKKGDKVYTTGFGIYNSGILIGEVYDVSNNIDGLSFDIKVRPIDNMNNFRYVMVMK